MVGVGGVALRPWAEPGRGLPGAWPGERGCCDRDWTEAGPWPARLSLKARTKAKAYLSPDTFSQTPLTLPLLLNKMAYGG